MIEYLGKYFFYTIFFIFFVFIILKNFIKDFSININDYYLFFILLLPFLDKIIEFFKQDFLEENKNFLNKKKLIKKFFIFFIFSLFLSFFKISLLSFLVWIFILFSLIFNLDTRFSFLISLVLLVYTPFLIFFKDNKLAESFSIYAYYFLIIWVLLEIFNNLVFKQNNKNDK